MKNPRIINLELLLTISLALLMVVLVSGFIYSKNSNKFETTRQSQINHVLETLEEFANKNGGYPSCTGGKSLCCMGTNCIFGNVELANDNSILDLDYSDERTISTMIDGTDTSFRGLVYFSIGCTDQCTSGQVYITAPVSRSVVDTVNVGSNLFESGRN